MAVPAAAAAAAAGTSAGTAAGTGASVGSIASGVSATTGAFNLLSNIGFGIYDRIHNREIEQANQANFNANLNFQKEQFQFQKDIQEMNRIENLTKEYTEAGLNPLLAAGMGMSTAGTLSGAGTSGNHAIQPHSKVEADMDSLLRSFQLSMQKELNDATINKLNAEANLSNTQAEDISATRDIRIDKLMSENNLTIEQANHVMRETNKITSEIMKNEANINLLNAEALAKTVETDINNYFGREGAKQNVEIQKLEKKKIEEEINQMQKSGGLKTWGQLRQWLDGFIGRAIQANYMIHFIGK